MILHVLIAMIAGRLQRHTGGPVVHTGSPHTGGLVFHAGGSVVHTGCRRTGGNPAARILL